MSINTLQAVSRKDGDVGKKSAKAIRATGNIPAILYGKSGNVSLSVSPKELTHLLMADTRLNTVIKVEYSGEKSGEVYTIVKEVQRDVISRELIHADFLEVALDKPLVAKVPLVLTGTSVGVKIEGGKLFQRASFLVITCLPEQVPAQFTLDITNLHAGESLSIADLGVEDTSIFKAPLDTELVMVRMKGVEEEEEEEYEMI